MRRHLDEREKIVVAIGAMLILFCIAYAAMPFSILLPLDVNNGLRSLLERLDDVSTHCGSAVVAGVHHSIPQCQDAARSRLLSAAIFIFLTAAATLIIIRLVLPAIPRREEPVNGEETSS